MQHCLSISDFTKECINVLIQKAAQFQKHPEPTLLSGRVLGTLFYEPSTRTRLSFTAAAERLGMSVLGFDNPKASSISKGETLADTIRMVASYSDVIALRHPAEGAAKRASDVSSVPIINAGDGANQHPTQTLLDLYTIVQEKGDINGQTIALVGDLKYGRTVHSLAAALGMYNVSLVFVSPKGLEMPAKITKKLQTAGVKITQEHDIERALEKATVCYMTRIQAERFPDKSEYERLKHSFELNKKMVLNANSGLTIMHPLPRVTEIHPDVDELPNAAYFRQAENGLYMRQALLTTLLGV